MTTDTRATEIATMLGQLAKLMSDGRRRESPQPAPRPMPEQVLLTVEEAAERLRIGKTKTYALIKTGEIESVLIGRLRRVHVDAVNAYASRLVAEQQHSNRSAA